MRGDGLGFGLFTTVHDNISQREAIANVSVWENLRHSKLLVPDADPTT